jgi:hypothetical protein
MPTKQVQLTYVSRACIGFGKRELRALLDQSRSNNLKNGIRGMLLFKDHSFMQVIEGAQSRVDELYDVIRRDPRHERIRLLRRSEDIAPQFNNWNMGFADLDVYDAGDYSHFLTPSASLLDLDGNSEAVTQLVRWFMFEKSRRASCLAPV